jgi:hypothetical protein
MRLLYMAGESSIRVRFKIPIRDRCAGMAVYVRACCGEDRGNLDVWINCETLVSNYTKVPLDEYDDIKFWVSRDRLKDRWNELHILSSYTSDGPIFVSDIALTFYESLTKHDKKLMF